MATVYLAHDLRHDRKVALKVLRPELSAVVGADRFLQEIKLTANLQHPHILPLHDSGQVDGHVFYVMPYVEGESLRARLQREKQLSIEEALDITKGVASALDYAHRRGVIHRDIKPENVLLFDGQAVVADFGIALAVSHAGGHRMTETGLSIGTPQYMSPEQAMGERELTVRSDVYALGAVLYEMLVGEPPFTGPTAQAIVAKVITEKAPRILAYRDTVPAHIDAAVRKALAKLPADRFTSAHEFAEALAGARARGKADDAAERPDDLERSMAVTSGVRRQGMPRWRIVAPWVVGAAFGFAMAVLGLKAFGHAPASPMVTTRFTVALPPGAEVDETQGAPRLSPDGSRLVLLMSLRDTNRLFIRRMDSLQVSQIPGTERAGWPFFSPDGRWLGFVQRHRVRRLPLDGGPVAELTDGDWNGAFGPDGALYSTPEYNTGLSYLAPGASRPRALTTPDSTRNELGHWAPRLLPDGKTLLFTNYSLPLPKANIEAMSLGSGKRKVVVEGAMDGRYAGGFLFFVRGAAVYAAPFDLRRLEVTGQAVPVLQDVAGSLSNGTAAFDVLENGTLAYIEESVANPPRMLVWVDRSGVERPARLQGAVYHFPRLSPDGKRIAVGIAENGVRNLWVYEIERDVLQRITSEQASSLGPIWSPDGRWLYWTRESPVFDLYRRPSNGAAPEELLLASRSDKHPSGISPDGKQLLFRHDHGASSDIGYVEVDAPAKQIRTFIPGSFVQGQAVFSPDGRWVAYQSAESGRSEVYLVSYPDPSRVRHQVSTGGGEQPMWTRRGRELVYRDGARMIAVTVDPVTGTTGRPAVLFSGDYMGLDEQQTWYDVTPDGQRFLMVKAPANAPPQYVVIVTNWLREVRAKLER
jgi:serine/threonine-protein kinase